LGEKKPIDIWRGISAFGFWCLGEKKPIDIWNSNANRKEEKGKGLAEPGIPKILNEKE
jgi:hypothetical protein